MAVDVKNFESIAAKIATYLGVDEVVMVRAVDEPSVVFVVRLGDDKEKCVIREVDLVDVKNRWELVGQRIAESAERLRSRVERRTVESVRVSQPQVTVAQWRAGDAPILLEPGDVLELVVRKKDVSVSVTGLLPPTQERCVVIGFDYATLYAVAPEGEPLPSPRAQVPEVSMPWLEARMEAEMKKRAGEPPPPASRFDAVAEEMKKL